MSIQFRPNPLRALRPVLIALAAMVLTVAVSRPSGADPVWQDAEIGAPAAVGSHAFADATKTLTVTGGGTGTNSRKGDQLHFTHTPIPAGDVEIIARLSSLTGDPMCHAGIMLRSGNDPNATTGAIVWTKQGWQSPDKSIRQDVSGLFGRDPASVHGEQGATSHTPSSPPVWLRLDRMGSNFGVYRSSDGTTWSMVANNSGGSFLAGGPSELGFFVDGGAAAKSATATFDSIRIGKPSLGYATSWTGDTFSQESVGFISGAIGAMWVRPDGTVYTNTFWDEGGEAAKIYKDGKPIKSLGGSSLDSIGSVTGDASHVYLYSYAQGGSIVQVPLDGDMTKSRTISLGTGLTIGRVGVVSGMAVASTGNLLISDSRDNKILVANPNAAVYYTSTNTSTNHTADSIDIGGVTNPAPMEVYQSQRESDYTPYLIPGLDPATKYKVRFHFAEFKHDKPGDRHFWLSAGSQRVEHFDIVAAAGGKDKAVVKEIDDVAPDTHGTLNIQLSTEAGSPDRHFIVNGIEIVKPDGTVALALACGGPTSGRFVTDTSELADKEFAFDRPGPMCVDKQGNFWIMQTAVLSTDTTVYQVTTPGAVKCYTPGGKFTGRQITDIADPVAIAISPVNGHLLVADNGPDQDIKVYGDIDTTPKRIGTFGAKGGIYSGKSPGTLFDATAGGWARFYQISAIGVDAAGNIYVNNSGSGTDLRSFTSDGKLNWKAQALHFVDCGDFDPDSDGADVYSPYKHLKMDYSQTKPGAEWSYVAWNWNAITLGTPPRNGHSSAVVRRLGPGRNLLMYTSGQGQSGPIQIYRFNGEIAIPCATISREKTGYQMWTDTNGDGRETPDEVSPFAVPGRIDTFDVDKKGDIWALSDGPKTFVIHFSLKSIDAAGVPHYGSQVADIEIIPLPTPTFNTSTIGQVARISYDSDRDTMYLLAPAKPITKPGDDLPSNLARFDNWSKGNRTPAWSITLPDPATDPNFMYQPPMPFNINDNWEAMDQTGDYIFIAELWGPVHVYDARTGKYVTTFNAGPEISGSFAWEDEQMGVRAYKRKNGEYEVLEENGGYRSKDNLFRWTPRQ